MTAVSSSANSPTNGVAVPFTASATANSPGSGMPTGKVTLSASHGGSTTYATPGYKSALLDDSTDNAAA